jgi:hypothetical protein
LYQKKEHKKESIVNMQVNHSYHKYQWCFAQRSKNMTIWSGIGMNYGHNVTASSYNTAQVDNDLAYLKANGITKIRIALPGYDDTPMLSHCQDMVKRALAKGFYVVWGVATGVGYASCNATTWNRYKAAVAGNIASWAKNNKLSELCIGNECDFQADGTTLNASTVRSDIRSLAKNVKSGGFTGKVSFSTTALETYMMPWITEGIGSLDCIGWNSYDIMANFNTRNSIIISAFGSKAYIAEFGGITNGYPDFNNENLYYIDTIGRIFLIKNAGISSGYFFCYRDGGFGMVPNTFGLIETTGTIHLARQAVLGVNIL